ncbi:MAG: hypothetical protein ACK446_02575 [Rhodobacterales bacterium]
MVTKYTPSAASTMRGVIPSSVRARIGAMAMGGTAKIAMFRPRAIRPVIGTSTNSRPARTATRLPIRNPAPDACKVAPMWRG